MLAHRSDWVTALRSGDHPQAKDQLGTERDGLCCLGVACVVAREAGVIESWDPTRGTPTAVVLDYFGLIDSEGLSGLTYGDVGDNDAFEGSGGDVHLVELNDNYGWTFARIADLIEAGTVPVNPEVVE